MECDALLFLTINEFLPLLYNHPHYCTPLSFSTLLRHCAIIEYRAKTDELDVALTYSAYTEAEWAALQF